MLFHCAAILVLVKVKSHFQQDRKCWRSEKNSRLGLDKLGEKWPRLSSTCLTTILRLMPDSISNPSLAGISHLNTQVSYFYTSIILVTHCALNVYDLTAKTQSFSIPLIDLKVEQFRL